MATDLVPAVVAILVGLVVCIFALIAVSAVYFCSNPTYNKRPRTSPTERTTTVTYRQVGSPAYMTELPSNAQYMYSSRDAVQQPIPVPLVERQRRIYLPDVDTPAAEIQPITGVYERNIPVESQSYGAAVIGQPPATSFRTVADVHQPPQGLRRTAVDYSL